MTKAQEATFDFIDSKVEGDAIVISWSEIVAEIKSKHQVKNWLTIRSVLQAYINEGTLKRTRDLTIEAYHIKR